MRAAISFDQHFVDNERGAEGEFGGGMVVCAHPRDLQHALSYAPVRDCSASRGPYEAKSLFQTSDIEAARRGLGDERSKLHVLARYLNPILNGATGVFPLHACEAAKSAMECLCQVSYGSMSGALGLCNFGRDVWRRDFGCEAIHHAPRAFTRTNSRGAHNGPTILSFLKADTITHRIRLPSGHSLTVKVVGTIRTAVTSCGAWSPLVDLSYPAKDGLFGQFPFRRNRRDASSAEPLEQGHDRGERISLGDFRLRRQVWSERFCDQTFDEVPGLVIGADRCGIEDRETIACLQKAKVRTHRFRLSRRARASLHVGGHDAMRQSNDRTQISVFSMAYPKRRPSVSASSRDTSALRSASIANEAWKRAVCWTISSRSNGNAMREAIVKWGSSTLGKACRRRSSAVIARALLSSIGVLPICAQLLDRPG